MWSVWLYLGLFLRNDQFGFAATQEPQARSRGNPAARLPREEFSSEHWEFTARFDSGHLLFVHFLITNIGWGDRNAVVVGHIVTPQGQTLQFDNTRSEKNWRLSSDRLHFEVGPNILDLHEPQYHLQVNKKSVRLDLRFQADNPATWSEALAQSGYVLDLLAAAVPIEGTLWTRGMEEPLTVRGTLAATHSWMQKSSSSVMVRRLEFFTLREDFPAYGIDLATPTGAPLRWFIVKPHEGQRLESETFELTFAQELEPRKEPGYTVPGNLRLRSAQLNGQITLTRIILRSDPFAKLPGPIRLLASTVLNLHPRQVWAVSPFSLTVQPDHASASLSSQISTELIEQHGMGVTAITFLNPLKEWAAELSDPREDIYTLDDGQPVDSR
jgi:hypothetical protein